ncbi:hypothetical protein [Demequina sp. NBRC 110053]|uniref:hypothetical protein n=1 Tax=Demequina sp. NBRC 110053 TaxID=1570342 RepID=UPI0011870523|nr:hypothetical protein [Demequina sp. NBRC 110053]
MTVRPLPQGGVMLWASERRAHDVGFERRNRDEWSLATTLDDAELTVTTEQTPVDAPWQTDAR